MKNLFNYLCFSLLLLANFESFAIGTRVINISTGTDNSFAAYQVPYGSFDHNWTVMVPGATSFQPVPATSCLGNYGNCNINKAWLCPGGNPNASQAGGDYFYKMTFFYDKNACPIQSAVINLNHVLADNIMNQLSVNGNPHALNISFTPQAPAQTITLAASEIVSGINEIVIRVHNFANSQTGMQIYGDLTITNSASFSFSLENQNSSPKNQFCLGAEDVVLEGATNPTNTVNNYSIQIGTVNGSNVTWIGDMGMRGGAPLWVNITSYFQNLPTPIVFQSGVTYRVKLTINSPACGVVESTQDFTYECCDNSTPDPTFSLAVSGTSTLKGASQVTGAHTWKVYNSTSSNGPFALVGTYSGKSFTANIGGPCYYVVHTISTECGEACDVQTICNSNCEEMECTIAPPTELSFDVNTNTFNWSPVPGALYYLIEVTLDDYACCPNNNPGGPTFQQAPKVIYAPTNTHILDYIADLGGVFYRCFSWRVIAVCPNGTRSASATNCVIGGPMEGFGVNGQTNTGLGDEMLRKEGIGVSLFPNPSKGKVALSIETINEVEYTVRIYDINGKLVKALDPAKTINKKSVIECGSETLGKGTYLIQIITSDHRIVSKKLIIQ